MLNRLRTIWTHQGGLAAVEFALILPVMLVLFFGIVETSMALGAKASVTSIAATAADLIAQESTVSSADEQNVFNAASAILYPHPVSSTSKGVTTSLLKIVISSIVYDKDNPATSGKVAWSDSSTGSGARTVGSTYSYPADAINPGNTANLVDEGGSIILVEVTYNYSSPTAQTVTGSWTMSSSFITRPRQVAQIARS
jgi:Flp pilus assembly protein TadG